MTTSVLHLAELAPTGMKSIVALNEAIFHNEDAAPQEPTDDDDDDDDSSSDDDDDDDNDNADDNDDAAADDDGDDENDEDDDDNENANENDDEQSFEDDQAELEDDHQIEDCDYKPVRFRRRRRRRRNSALQPEVKLEHQQQVHEQLDPLKMDEVCNAPSSFEILCHGCGYRHRTPHRHVTRNMNRLLVTYPDVPFPPLTQLYLCCLWFKRGHPTRIQDLREWLAPIAPPIKRPLVVQLAGRPRKRKADGSVAPIPAPIPVPAAATVVPIAPPRAAPEQPQSLADLLRSRSQINSDLGVVLTNLRSTLASLHGLVDTALVDSRRPHNSET